MIIVNSFRGLALILLIIILIIKEIPFKNLFKDLMIQFYMALTCILILLLVDNIFGFILSICLLTLYFRIYTNELNLINKNNNNDDINNLNVYTETITDKCTMNMEQINSERRLPVEVEVNNNDTNCLVPYITEENLLAAQSNIVNPEGYNKEYYGVDKGIYKEDVYGSQGLDNKNIHIRGYDIHNSYLGTMQYDII
jgi:Ca2+/Na+ antiporter